MEKQAARGVDSVDYSRCPLPKTHRRLVEAHILWHQALEHYQDPDAFRANLNSLIQAIRNVTFILQTEKRFFRGFDDWYLPWQERLKADAVCAWLQDARTTIVHQGDLDTHSTAVVKLLTWRDHLLLESSVPASAPSSLILRNISLVQLLNNVHVSPADLQAAAVLIERRWVVANFRDREILDCLAQAYGLIADLVRDGHVHLMNSVCIPAEQNHGHFPSPYDRTGTLRCMAMGPEERAHRFDLGTGAQFKLLQGSPMTGHPAAAAKRYRLAESDRIEPWQGMDPVLVARKIAYVARRMLSKDKAHIRIVHIRDGRGNWHLVRLDATNRTEKHLLIRLVARLVETTGADALIDVGEIWFLPKSRAESATLEAVDSLEHVKGRREALQITVATREGVLQTEITEFTRGPFGGIKFGDTHWMYNYQAFYLRPVFEVWRRQGFARLPDGRAVRRVWEPDALDICFCGGPKRFGECCGPLLSDHAAKQDIEKALDAAQGAGNLEQAERFARAALAQYVIWVKQHTAGIMNVAPELYRRMVAIDERALVVHLARLRGAIPTNRHTDVLLTQLRHIATVIGVPELSTRITGLAAQLLLDHGEYSRAGEELKSLGDLEQVNDPLALVLTCKLFDLPLAVVLETLNRAAARAGTEEERQFIQLELASHLRDRGQVAEALQIVRSVLSECCAKESFQESFLRALSLRYEITQERGDWETTEREFRARGYPEGEERLAIVLIEHGHFAEAETLLSGAIEAGELVAQLLAVDARLRSGRTNAARDLFDSIDSERVTGGLQYPYAATCADVALSTGDSDLKKRAAMRLREIPAAGTHVAAEIARLLAALDDAEGAKRPSIWTAIRGLLNS